MIRAIISAIRAALGKMGRGESAPAAGGETARESPDADRAFIAAVRAAFDTDEYGILDALWLARSMPVAAPETAATAVLPPPAAASPPVKPALAQKSAAPAGEVPKAARPAEAWKAAGSLYAGAPEASADEPFVPVRPVRIPAGAALPQGLEMVRGFRPLPRRAASRIAMELDEEATAEATAQHRMKVVPVMRPQQERWFEAALVVEQTPSMEIWSQAAIEIERMLQYTGSFRDVRTYWLHMQPRARLVQESGAESSLESLRDPQARRIVFLFSAGTSESWADGSLGRALNLWAPSIPVVLVHALPQRLWKSTNLGEPAVLVGNPTPGGANAQLRRQRAWWARRRAIYGERSVLPVFSLERASVEQWAQMLVSRRKTSAPAFLVRTTPAPPLPDAMAGPAPSARERVGQFGGTASPEAFRLAVHLAAGPFTLAVVQLVQSALLGKAALQSQVAEVMLSGLAERVTPVGARVPPDQVVFRFDAAAQAILLESLRDDDARELAGLMQTYIAEQLGRPDDLVVRLPDPEGKERVPASAEPFARLKENLLNRLKLTSQPVSVIVPRTMAGGAASTRPVWPIQAPLAGVGILWVDDHPENNVRETAELERMGAVVTASVSTEEGMAALREGAYQVVLTDMVRGREPEAGLDFLRRLGRDRVTTPVIVYAARWASDPGAETRAKNAGALGCTNQPDRLQELIFQATGRDWTGRYLDLMAQIGFDDTDSLAVIRISPEVVAGALAERARDNRELYRVLTTAVDAITGCDYVQVFLGMTALDLAADHIGKGKEGYPRPDPGGVIGRAHSEGRTRSVPNVLQSEEYIRAEKSTMSELAIPILGEGKRAVGVLNLESPETNAFTTEQVRWLEALVAAYPFPRLIARIFMIHAERDRDRARQLARACEVAGVEIALEGSGLAAFENANCYVVLLSPEAESSRLLHSGLAWALDRSASSSGKVQVIPVLLDRCEIPPMLRPFQLIDLSAGIAKGDDRLLEAIQERRFDPPWRARGAEEKDASQAARQQAEAAAARGREAFAGEEYAKAIAAFDEAISLAPRAGYYRERGLSNWYWHRYGEAIVDYNEALKMDPALGEAVWFGRGQVLAEAGRYEEAIADLERVLANRPESESAGYLYRAKGVARAGLGQAAEAQRDFDRSMSLAPENAWLYYSLAKFQEAAGDWDRAFANYALSLYKRIPKLNRRKLVDAVASVEGVTGKLAIDPEAVARQLDGPEKAILERARSAMRAGEYGLALLAAEVLRSSAAEGPETGLMRCVCHRRLGNFDMANTEVERLFEMSAPPPGAVVERGYARLRARDFDGARADFSAALNAGQDSADSTSSAEAFCGRALVSLRLGHVFQARESIRAALQLAPRNAECMLTRARILEEAGERAAAEAAYRDSLRADDPRLSTRERDGVLETLRHFGEEESLAE